MSNPAAVRPRLRTRVGWVEHVRVFLSPRRTIARLRGGGARPVLALMSWTVASQVLSVGSMLVLLRIFDPAQFGIFSLFLNAMAMIGIVVAARYEFAIGLPEKDRDAAAIFSLCVACATLAVPLLWFALSSLPLARITAKFAPLEPWMGWLAVGAGATGWMNAAIYLQLRHRGFTAVGRSKVVAAVCMAGGQVIAGLLVSRGIGSLILPLVLSQAATAAYLLANAKGFPLFEFRWRVMLSEVRRFVRFPLHVAPGSLLDGITTLLPVAGVAAIYSPALAGIYALADRAMRMPVTLVGSSMQAVFYQRAASVRQDAGASRHLLVNTWKSMAMVAAAPSAVILLAGPTLFGFVFGSKWALSGQVAQIMILSIAVYFVSYPTSNIMVVRERTRTYLGWQIFQIAAVSTALLLAWRYTGGALLEGVMLIVVAQALTSFLSMALQWRAIVDKPIYSGPVGATGIL